MIFLQFSLFLTIAALGGIIGSYLKLPLGTMIGAMFAVGISKHFEILSFQTSTPLTFIVQLLLGTMFGLSFIKLTKEQIKKLFFSFIFIFCSVILMSVGTGFLVDKLTFLDLGASILSSSPGGIPEMAITAKALKLEAPIIVVIHLIRVIVVMSFFTILLNYFYKRDKEIDTELNKHTRKNVRTLS
ncbi:AbrB family transcriptional regulator [Robertmurraya massiliosenegalensis]|uniref:AbrB family transcriptional regulator n=1 Tax=Robertmurraya TaxID=2837507 RepID=UPI0039A4D0F0